jgi:AcrR family transcriptional regulator
MQVADEKKRLKILEAAAELFARHPFHKVLLSDVAEAAAVGKGTLYIYFRSKEDLYLSVLFNGFSRLMDHLRQHLAETGPEAPAASLDMVVRELVSFGCQNPHLFEVMRTVPGWEAIDRKKWDAKRRELNDLIESLIRQGNSAGVFDDPDPVLTARYIPGLVRSALLYGPAPTNQEALSRHIRNFVRTGISAPEYRYSKGIEQ